MIKTRAKDLRGVAASSRIAEAIIAFACAQNRLPALIPLSSNWYKEVGWFLLLGSNWLFTTGGGWWLRAAWGLTTSQPGQRSPNPQTALTIHSASSRLQSYYSNPDRFLSTLRSFTIYKCKTDFFEIIHLQTCQINHDLQPLLWNGVAAFNESVHGGQI